MVLLVTVFSSKFFFFFSRFFLGEKLRIKQIEGIGDKIIDKETGEARKVGAGGIGGGVNLAVSNEETQKRNNKMLKKFLKHQRKLMNKEAKKKENQEVNKNQNEEESK